MSYHIFAGRFQPFHLGHLEIVEKSLLDIQENDILVIGVVTAFKGLVVDENFAINASEHHSSERNPWKPSVPLKAVSELIKEYPKANQIMTTILPAPDTSWPEISKWFPLDRKWIIPEANEAFDERKVEFYEKQGETVIRYKERSNISGWELRNYFFSSDYERFKKHIPANIVDIYWNGETQ